MDVISSKKHFPKIGRVMPFQDLASHLFVTGLLHEERESRR